MKNVESSGLTHFYVYLRFRKSEMEDELVEVAAITRVSCFLCSGYSTRQTGVKNTVGRNVRFIVVLH